MGLFALIGGLLLLIVATIRGVHRVKKGYFRKGSKGLYDFKEKNTISFGVIYLIYPLVITAIMIYKSIESRNFGSMFLLFWAILVQYSISLALPEFYLLLYFKFKYKEFIIKMPEKYIKRMEKKKKEKLMKKQKAKIQYKIEIKYSSKKKKPKKKSRK